MLVRASEPTRSSRRRVLMAVHGADWGGAQLVALGQARALRGEFDLVIAIGEGPLRPGFAEAATAVVGNPSTLPIWGASRGRWALQIARAGADALRIAALVVRHRIDLVVVNSTTLVAPVLGARLAGVPVIVHAQEAPKSAAARRLFRVHGALASTVVAISPWIERAFTGARAHVLANPVGIPVPRDPGPRARFAGERVRLCMVGTLDRHKRPTIAIEAVKRLREQAVDADLTLCGAEPDAEFVAELRAWTGALGMAEHVHFAGPTDDVPAYLLAADALVLPAGEVTPLVLMEAMALRTPVVAAHMGGIPDVVKDDVTGLLVTPDDPDALAAAVSRLRTERGLAQRLTEAGRRRVEEHFDELPSHVLLSAEIRELTSGRVARPAEGGRVMLRRVLGAASRRARATALQWRTRLSAKPAGAVLVYHETHAVPPGTERVVPGVTAETLDRHLRHIRRTYRSVKASDFRAAVLARRRGGRIPVAITFDDDLASHLDVAAPLLERHGCPASFFLTGAGLDAPHGFWWQRLQTAADRGIDPRPTVRRLGLRAPAELSLADIAANVEREPPEIRAALTDALAALGEDSPAHRLSRTQVGALARTGFEIGFHTRTHAVLTELPDAELARALRAGRRELEDAAGQPLTAIAYPHGRADARVAAAARAEGFAAGFGGRNRSPSDPLLMARTELLVEDPSTFALVMASELRAQR